MAKNIIIKSLKELPEKIAYIRSLIDNPDPENDEITIDLSEFKSEVQTLLNKIGDLPGMQNFFASLRSSSHHPAENKKQENEVCFHDFVTLDPNHELLPEAERNAIFKRFITILRRDLDHVIEARFEKENQAPLDETLREKIKGEIFDELIDSELREILPQREQYLTFQALELSLHVRGLEESLCSNNTVLLSALLLAAEKSITKLSDSLRIFAQLSDCLKQFEDRLSKLIGLEPVEKQESLEALLAAFFSAVADNNRSITSMKAAEIQMAFSNNGYRVNALLSQYQEVAQQYRVLITTSEGDDILRKAKESITESYAHQTRYDTEKVKPVPTFVLTPAPDRFLTRIQDRLKNSSLSSAGPSKFNKKYLLLFCVFCACLATLIVLTHGLLAVGIATAFASGVGASATSTGVVLGGGFAAAGYGASGGGILYMFLNWLTSKKKNSIVPIQSPPTQVATPLSFEEKAPLSTPQKKTASSAQMQTRLRAYSPSLNSQRENSQESKQQGFQTPVKNGNAIRLPLWKAPAVAENEHIQRAASVSEQAPSTTSESSSTLPRPGIMGRSNRMTL